MKIATTIQMTPTEDRLITSLKKELGLPTKKAVVMEGVRALKQLFEEKGRVNRLQKASYKIRSESQAVNREWSSLSTSLKSYED